MNSIGDSSQETNESVISSQDQDSLSWNDQRIRIASPRAPRLEDFEDFDDMIGPDIYVAEKKQWGLKQIDEVCSDEERNINQESDSYKGMWTWTDPHKSS